MKIILFGASAGGKNFIKKHAGQYEFLAIADNDERKHGKLLENIEIIAPNCIHQYTYDKIIVASMYVTSISQQLSGLGIPSDKIEFAAKNLMKVEELPFENPEIVERANQLIVEITKALNKIPHYYTFGTLLGIVRDGKLIPWDDDIDIAIYNMDTQRIKDQLLMNIPSFEALFDIRLYERIYSHGKSASITMDCFEHGQKLFIVNFDCMYVEGEMVKQELNETPLRYFQGQDELTFNNVLIPVPKNYESYLDYTYGDWHIVKKNTSFADNTISFREPLYSCTVQPLYETKGK